MQTELLASVIAGSTIFGLSLLVMFSYMLYRAFKEAHHTNDVTGMGRHNTGSFNSFELAEMGRSQASMDSYHTRSTRTRHGGSMDSLRPPRFLRSLHSRSGSLASMQPSNNSRVNLHRQTSADSIGSGPLPDFLDPKRRKRRSRSAPSVPPLRW